MVRKNDTSGFSAVEGLIAAVIILAIGGVGYFVYYSRHHNLGWNDPSSAYSDSKVQSNAIDINRKTDIKALQVVIEAFKDKAGYYPSLMNLNNPAWRTTNTDKGAMNSFKDPKGTTNQLSAKPAANVYAYQAMPVGCDNKSTSTYCTSYTLTATLNNGSTYVLNNF